MSCSDLRCGPSSVCPPGEQVEVGVEPPREGGSPSGGPEHNGVVGGVGGELGDNGDTHDSRL